METNDVRFKILYREFKLPNNIKKRKEKKKKSVYLSYRAIKTKEKEEKKNNNAKIHIMRKVILSHIHEEVGRIY